MSVMRRFVRKLWCSVIFQCWSEDEGTSMMFFEAGSKSSLAILDENAVLLYQVQAPSWEAAMKEHHRRQGWEPYSPLFERSEEYNVRTGSFTR